MVPLHSNFSVAEGHRSFRASLSVPSAGPGLHTRCPRIAGAPGLRFAKLSPARPICGLRGSSQVREVVLLRNVWGAGRATEITGADMGFFSLASSLGPKPQRLLGPDKILAE